MNAQPSPVPKEVIDYFQKKEAERMYLLRTGMHIPLVPPVMFQGVQMRAFGNRVYKRPEGETFHMFLIAMLQQALGRDWWEEQQKLPERERHFIATCFEKFNAWVIKHQPTAERTPDGKMWSAVMDGYAKSLLILAFDVTCLTHMMKLPDSLLKRLKSRKEYQGARYEIAIAAIFARLDCEITFTDEKSTSKRCEFVAKHRKSGFTLAVEAKSRRREGVLHQAGNQPDQSELLSARAAWRLFKDALEQSPKDVPFATFIDVNAPLTPDVPLDEKQWVKDAKEVVSQKLKDMPPEEYPLNAAFFTNFSYHYQTESESLQGESMGVIVPHSKFPPPDGEFFNYLLGALTHYGYVPPVEIEEKSDGS